MQSIKSIKFSNILLMISVDLAFNWILILTFELESIGGMIAIVCILLFSILLYFVVRQLKNRISIYFLFNIGIAPITLYLLIICLVVVKANSKYENRKFSVGNSDYLLHINKIPATYDISKITSHNENYLDGMVSGKILKINNSIILLGARSTIRIYKDTMFGFPHTKDTIILKDN